MFDNLEAAVRAERLRLEQKKIWLSKFKLSCKSLSGLQDPWQEKDFINELSSNIPNITKIGAVDGGLLSEAMTGFDLILYRAAGVVFHGIGSKVKARYIPKIDPDTQVFFHTSLESRFEFSKLATLLRLQAEYQVAIQLIKEEKPTILFIDGRISPLQSDLMELRDQSELIKQTQEDLKDIYRKLIITAKEHKVLLCGIVKDSRSSEISQILVNMLPHLIKDGMIDGSKIRGWRTMLNGLLDEYLGEGILDEGQRTAWLRSQTPGWLNFNFNIEIWSCLVRPIIDDIAMRIEVVYSTDLEQIENQIQMGLAAYAYLCKHGLPIAIPTIITDADSRAKLSNFHLEAVVDQISITLGVPKDHLRKRRSFHNTLE